MARILLIGVEPDAVDFADPALPPGMDAAAVRRGVEQAMAALAAAGHEATHHYVLPAPDRAVPRVSATLAAARYDCVLFGGGVTNPPSNRPLFEALINAVARHHPAPAIGLIARPADAPAAVARLVPGG